ncbi:MFS transporter [Brevibacillus sp. SYP-B805]|uniref:MFS transporter n=1 Tax=Brevibacillus sp. SYP-B805 TaxID=1578199 RepID=UPI0013EADD5F|nr:MFS transporter [Brevibacillus sp. SYP-B805]NGQ97288.1 MFS transporter [Brevibacillus sp. SYP-B805]
MAAHPSVWRNVNFVRLWFGTVLSTLGDNAFYILLPWYVIEVTGSEGAIGGALLAMSLPRLVFMLAGGIAADRFNRKTIMSLSLLARGAVLLIFSLMLRGAVTGLSPTLYLVAVVFGLVDAFFWPVRSSIMPFIVDKQALPRANSLMESSQQISTVLGSLAASLLLGLSSYPLIFTVIASLFFLSMVAILPMRLSHNQAQTAVPSVGRSFFPELADGIRYVCRIRVLTLMMCTALFVNMMFSGPINIALPSLIKLLGWNGSAFGYMLGALGFGAIIGSAITGYLNGFRGYLPLVAVFICCLGTAVAMIAFMTGLPFGLFAMLLAGSAISMVNIPMNTYIQTIVDPRKLGRVFSLLTLVSLGFNPVSFAVTSYLLDHHLLSQREIFGLGGVTMALLGLSLLLFRDFRRLEEHPEWQKTLRQTRDQASDQPVPS